MRKRFSNNLLGDVEQLVLDYRLKEERKYVYSKSEDMLKPLDDVPERLLQQSILLNSLSGDNKIPKAI